MRRVVFDASKEYVGQLAEEITKKYQDSMLVVAPLSGNISVYAPSKKGKHKGYHRMKFEVWIPEDAIRGEGAIKISRILWMIIIMIVSTAVLLTNETQIAIYVLLFGIFCKELFK